MFNKQELSNSAFSCCVAIQLTVLAGRALGALAVPSALYDGALYISFILFAIITAVILKYQPCRFNIGLEIGVTFLLLSAVFKSTIYDNSPFLANAAVIVLLVVAVAIKLFAKEIPGLFNKGVSLIKTLAPWGTIIAVVLIVAFVDIPNLKSVLAEIFIGEQAHHLDFFVMSPGLACYHGGLPYVDVISQYGVGIPVVLAKLSRFFGGFDYLPLLKINVFFGIVYFVLFYFFTRAWLGSALLAFAAFLVCFRLQMFHYGVSPLCWIYPSATPIRFGLDILWIWLLWRHLQSGRNIFLWLAAIYSGFAVYFMTSTGICMVASFYAYFAGLWLIGSLRKEKIMNGKTLSFGIVLPWLSGLIFFWITLGHHVFSAAFWKNCIEYMSYFSNGRGGLPMHESLKYRNYWVAFMALLMPLMYVGTAVALGVLLWREKLDRKYLLPVIIAIYGLANYQYFVVRSAMTSYYQNAVPFVLICAFWVHVASKKLSEDHVKKLRLSCVLLALYALVTNHNYISYPNIFNFSRNPMVDITVAQHFPDRQGYFHHLVKHIKEEDKVAFNAAGDGDEHLYTEDSFKTDKELIDFIAQDDDFSVDAALIDQLTSSQDKVAIFSSFETKILIQANRAPFFYHTPLLTSQPMRVRYFPGDAAHSPGFLKDTLEQLGTKRPKYVFIENVFLQENYPASYKDSNAMVLAIVAYIRQNYTPYKRGKYLTAMELK